MATQSHSFLYAVYGAGLLEVASTIAIDQMLRGSGRAPGDFGKQSLMKAIRLVFTHMISRFRLRPTWVLQGPKECG